MAEQLESLRVGDARITRIAELELRSFAAAALYPAWKDELMRGHEAWLQADSMDATGGRALMSVHSWLVQTPKHTLLIDTGAGNGKNRPHTPYFHHLDSPYLERLAAAGVQPEDVDYVLLTHLHVDHVGWNTRLVNGRWVPTFPNARYVFSGAEFAYFTNPANLDERNKTSFLVQSDSILPVIEAGQADMIAVDGSEVLEGVRFYPAAGHSFDHAAIGLVSGGEEALFTGDLLHHPLQVRHPDLNTLFDAFGEQARASRLWALEHAAQRAAIVCGGHLPVSGAGRVRRAESGFAWLPV